MKSLIVLGLSASIVCFLAGTVLANPTDEPSMAPSPIHRQTTVVATDEPVMAPKPLHRNKVQICTNIRERAAEATPDQLEAWAFAWDNEGCEAFVNPE
jgi:hypothetical protein